MDFTEAEIQVLASLDKASEDGTGVDQAKLEDGGERFGEFLVDWSDAFASLAAKGLIEGDRYGFHLTDAARPIAQACNQERPNRYWYYYQNFYPAAFASKAHSRLCERAFGMDLCQEGQVDMVALNDLLSHLDLSPGDHVLDLGCGAGVISKYIADQTQAIVTGVDYAASAIAEANERTLGERPRLKFEQADINALDFPARSFDAVISLDTLYWVSNLTKVLSQVAALLRPGGQLAIFIAPERNEGDPPEVLEADGGELALCLNELGLPYKAFDYTANLLEFWQRNGQAAIDLRSQFEAEGNGFIADSLIKEAEEQYLPGLKAGTIKRYLYLVSV